MSVRSGRGKSRRLPLKVRLLLDAYTFSVDAACRSNVTVNRYVANIFDPKATASTRPKKGVASFDITIDKSNNLWFRLYNPTTNADSNKPLPVIIYFHGGGFCFMGANSKYFDRFCRRLAREIPAVVISVNYRLAPEYKFPCQYEDGLAALKFIDRVKLSNFSVHMDLGKCFVSGDSAGGNIAHHVVLKACIDEYKFSNVKILGVIPIQPFFGGEERTEAEIRLRDPARYVKRTDWLWKAFLPKGSDRNHPVVNVFGPNAVDISEVKLPSILVFVGGFDPLRDWQKRYYQGLKKLEKDVYLIEYPKAVHGFYAMPKMPESSLLVSVVRDFVNKRIDHSYVTYY